MKTKLIITLTIFSTPFIIDCCEKTQPTPQHTVTIMQATAQDIDALNAISHQYYNNSFKPIWEKNYASMTPAHHTIDSFVEEKIKNNNIANEKFIVQQQENQNNNHKLLIAKLEQNGQLNTVGYCRLEKKDTQTIYINFIIVAEEFRKRGIAKLLAEKAMNIFDDVTTCKFRALAHNDFVNDLYTQHGCEQTGTVSLDTSTGQISIDPNAPITHIDYSYTIKK